MMRSKIKGIGMAVPPNVISNADLTQWMDTSDEWILQRTGIKQRYWAEFDDSTSVSDLALEAARGALADADMQASEIDMIIFATLSPDASYPGAGCFLQRKLELPGIPAIDIRQQCTGFIYGLSIADVYLRSGQYRNVLLVGADLQSKTLDISSRGRAMTVLFGDGAGAVVVSATEVASDLPATSREPRILSCHLHADGRYVNELIWASPGSAQRIWNPPELAEQPSSYPQMNGRHVFQHAVRLVPEVTHEALSANGVEPDEVDLYINHQANKRIDDRFARALGVSPEKVVSTIEHYGNTTAATIPIGIYEAKKTGRLEPGMLVCSSAFGAGFTWAAALYRW